MLGICNAKRWRFAIVSLPSEDVKLVIVGDFLVTSENLSRL